MVVVVADATLPNKLMHSSILEYVIRLQVQFINTSTSDNLGAYEVWNRSTWVILLLRDDGTESKHSNPPEVAILDLHEFR